ncbi:phosphodiester glycosidase family protein [Salinithrix halophila]|uniref:Phosphodiester glycosidase family protein n=1 Tax=Salinithrix halophila TaxID=1485204 RepID=A0ABV8JFN4_9BACL
MGWRKGIVVWLVLSLVWAPIPLQAQDPVHESGEDLLKSQTPSTDVYGTKAPAVIHEERSGEAIAKGVALMSVNRFDTRGWIEGATLTVDLAEPAVKSSLLTAGKVASSQSLSEQMKRAGAIAGVNADFFDIGNTEAAFGAEVSEGKIRKSGGDRLAVSVTRDRLGQVGQLLLEGRVVSPYGERRLDAINAHVLGKEDLGLYTSDWGKASRRHLVGSPADYTEVTLNEGKVTEVREGSVREGQLEEGQAILSGKGKAANFLRQLNQGDEVSVEYGTRPDAKNLLFAVGGGAMLVKNGEISNHDDGAVHPRTAVGFSRDGKKMILTAVDGRSKESRGMTLWELARWMKEQGAWTAINLDGGGSTTLIARELGQEGLKVINTPSDGRERPVPNGIGIWNQAKTGHLKGFNIHSTSPRVFKGFTRRFRADAFDTAFAPMKIDPRRIRWKTKPATLGRFEGEIFRAARSGTGKVTVRSQGVRSDADIHVLGRPVTLSIEPKQMGLEKGKEARFLVTGKDRNGYRTYIEPGDIRFTIEDSLVDLTPNPDGSVTVTPKKTTGSAVLTARVGGLTAQAGITIGLEENRVEDFEKNTPPWTFSKAPAETTGSLTWVDAPERGGKAIQLDYDFTASTKTRAVYANPPGGLMDLPGDVRKIGVYVHGDGNGHWLRTRIKDAVGVFHTLDLARNVDWIGWKYVETEVPPGVQYPIKLNQIYLVEPDGKVQDKGSIMLDDVTVRITETLNLPRTKSLPHPMVRQHSFIPARKWKYAVMNDLHLDSTHPRSKEVENAKQALRELSKEDVDFVIFNGDVVDTDTKENYTFFKKILEENLSAPSYVIPGNHETYGSGNLDNFADAFGRESLFRTFVHKRTRFILFNTSFEGLRVSDANQWFRLKQLLKESEEDAKVENLVILGHHPLRDPLPAKTSQFKDGGEAELLEKLLTRFREASGKPAAVISAHAHVNHWGQLDGIPYGIIGPVGKRAYGAQDDGGFYSYAVFGVGRAGKRKVPWMTVEVRPILQDLILEKQVFTVGEQEKVPLHGVQAEGWTFPLGYPAMVRYEGTKGLIISNKGSMDSRAIARFNPVTGTIRFYRRGSVELTVKTGGMEKRFSLKGQ